MKKSIFFPLSSTHFTSTLAVSIRRKHGLAGYGIYLSIMQYLANTDERVLPLESAEDIGYELRLKPEDVLMLINNFFQVKDNVFFCQELEDSLSYYDAKQAAASKGGKQSAANLTTEQRIERAKNAAKARYIKTSANTANQNEKVVSKPANQPANNNNITEDKITENNITEKTKKEENKKEENKEKVSTSSDLVSVSNVSSSHKPTSTIKENENREKVIGYSEEELKKISDSLPF